MKNAYHTPLTIAALLLAAAVAGPLFAAGGGAGSPAPCDRDDWVCGSWSACLQGQRTRKCQITFDCPNVATPKPAESESCVAACTADTWVCSEWGACSGGARTRTCSMTKDCAEADTPRPPERETCVTAEPGCKTDTWVCEDWAACDPQGVQRRDCRLTVDCPGIQTAKPVSDRACPALQCGDLPTLRERVSCRLKLAPAGMARELELRYLPELCATMADAAERDACIAKYKAFDPCWSAPTLDERVTCAKGTLGLGDEIRPHMVTCLETEDEAARAACVDELRKRVYWLISFRLYDLEERAEDLADDGVPTEVIADFVVTVEEKKAEFFKATSKDARKKAILDVRAAWQTFVTKAKTYLR